MQLYGDGFADGRLAFSIIALSTVPTVVANVYLQELVGAARMWRQLWLHGPFIGALGAGFLLLVPRYHALGYSLSLLLGSIVLLGSVLIASRVSERLQVGSGVGG